MRKISKFHICLFMIFSAKHQTEYWVLTKLSSSQCWCSRRTWTSRSSARRRSPKICRSCSICSFLLLPRLPTTNGPRLRSYDHQSLISWKQNVTVKCNPDLPYNTFTYNKFITTRSLFIPIHTIYVVKSNKFHVLNIFMW